ncbi:MAG: hypothetical protein K2J20_05770, partial [Bacilli bacterium]|nr:hypothetical protein [Bacilli bacterium]
MKKTNQKNEVNKKSKKTYKNNNKKMFFFIIPIIILLVLVLTSVLFYLYLNDREVRAIQNVVVKSESFHEIEVSWDEMEKVSNYIVLISNKEFTNNEVDDDLKDGKFDLDYQTIEIENENKLKYSMVIADTDYYISVVAYKNSGNKRKYYKASEVVKSHTTSLEVNKITDLSGEEVTDSSLKLKWSLIDELPTNLDGTEIELSYTLFTVNGDEITELKSGIKENSYDLNGLKPFTKYSYKVVVNAVVDGKIVNSDDSNILEVITKPSPVSGLSGKSGGTSSISLKWDKYDKIGIDDSDILVTYSVYASDSKDGTYKLLKENITNNSYVENGLSQNKTRYYYIVTNNEIDNEKYVSDKSAVVFATT